MFTLVSQEGDHKIFDYNIHSHRFREYFENLYNTNDLENLHLISRDFQDSKDVLELGYLNDKDTDLHRIFYNDIKTNDTFKNLYIEFVKDIYNYFYPEEEFFIYQSFPSVRLQFPESVAVPLPIKIRIIFLIIH